MKITVTGSLGNISRMLTEKLVTAGHEVRVISSHADRKAAIEALGAIPWIGSVADGDFVKRAFEGSDAVYLMVPPAFGAPDYKQFTVNVGQNYAEAVKQAGIAYVVNLSSSGSPLAGTPPLTEYQNLEVWLDALPAINVLHLRPGGFYSNFYGSVGIIKNMGIIGNNFAGHMNMVMSHPADIADAAFDALHMLSFKGRDVRYIVSDVRNGKEAASLLGAAIGRPDLQWVELSDSQLLEGLMQNGFSRDAAQHYIVDMGIAIREGIVEKHYRENTCEVVGGRSFAGFAREFARAYQFSQ